MTRLSADEAVNLIENAELNELGAMALARKRELHPQGVTTFIVDRNINYTNACWVDCKFCAFYRDHKDEDAYVLGFDEIGRKIEELIAIGGTQILFQGGVHPKLKIEWYEDLVEFIAKNYPSVAIHGFSAVEIDYIARISRISTREALRRLREKGLYSMPGAGAEILSDRVRDLIAPKKCDVQTWLRIHREAHEEGLKTTATMMFGTVETTREIVEHWEHIRRLQDATNGFRAFILWSFQGLNTRLAARLFLDNVSNIQSSWVTQGSYIGQLALLFGANDLGSTMMEENVVKAAGASYRMNQDEMIRLIKDIGEKPANRNTNYDILERFYE